MTDENDAIQFHAGMILKHNIDLPQRTLVIEGEIDHKSAIKFDKHMKILEYKDEVINVYLNSDGGCIISHYAMVDRIRTSPCPVAVFATGQVMSAALTILAVGFKRYATENTFFMHHGLRGTFPFGNTQEHEVDLKYSKALDQRRFKILADTTKQPYSFWSTTGKSVDHYFTAEQALEYGLIDEILK